MHQLVFVVGEHLSQRLAVLGLEMRVRFFSLPWHPVADDGVHGMVRAAAVDTDPFDLLGLAPFREFAVRAGVLDHVGDLVGGRLIPAEVVKAGVDDQDIAFVHIDPFLDHLRCVDVVVAGDV